MNVSMYGKMYSYAVSYFNLSIALASKERCNVNHPKYCHIPKHNYLATSRLTLTAPIIATGLMATTNQRHHSKVDIHHFC